MAFTATKVGKQLSVSKKHTIWHHLWMVVYSEVVNLIWFAVGVVLTVGGLAIFNFGVQSFLIMAIGLPIALIGASVAIFKLHEIILVLVRPSRLQAICIFCRQE